MTDETAHLALSLRDYQIESLDRIDAAERRGVRRQLGVAATGLGKTIMFSALAERRGGRALILAHRDELVNQAVAKIRQVWPGVDVGIVKGAENDVRAHVVVASVQTLARPKRLGQLVDAYAGGGSLLAPCDPFGLVVVDEAHHTAAVSYRAILDAVRAGHPAGEIPDDPESDAEPAGPLLLGVTATPDRGDGRGLSDLFDEIVFSYDVLWGIRSGYLADIKGRRVTVESFDLAGVKVSRGDYQAGDAGRALEESGAPATIAKAIALHAPHRRTLVFTPTVATAHQVVDECVRCAIPAAMVSGETPIDERRAILRAFSTGDVDVLANCMVLTEGFDEPRVDCIVVARPTKSRALYTQMIGRGTRRHPDKTDCLILDVVGVAEEHSLVTIPSLFGIDEHHRKRMVDGTGALTDTLAEQDVAAVAAGRLRAEDVEMFRKVTGQGIAWVQTHTHGDPLRRYIRPLGTRKVHGRTEELPTVVLAQRTPDKWTAGLLMPDGGKRVLMALVSLELAQGVAEDFVRKRGGVLVTTDAEWRARPPSAKARKAAKSWRLPNIESYKTAGELSDALTLHIARKKRQT